MKHQIKHRYNDSALFECDVPDDLASGLATRHALEQATKAGANLDGANLSGAYLSGAYLSGAYLRGADLSGADLRGADLRGADLGGADLGGADLGGADLGGAYLRGADLRGADLRGADLEGKKLVGERPVFMVGPIGSRCDYFVSFMTESGVMLRAGCFFGTVEEFSEKLATEHGDNQHGREYAAALVLIEAHAEIWG